MKKLSFIAFVLVSSLSFTSCTKQGDTGAAGATGPAGSQGQNLSYYYIPGYILPGGFTGSAAPYQFIDILPTLDSHNSNLVYVSFTIQDPSDPKAIYYSMPATNVFTTGDELYYTFGHDTLAIFYTGASQPGYQINWRADIIPQP